MHENQGDAVIAEIRAVRHRISERAGHDPARLVAYYIELQRRYQERLIGPPATEPPVRRPVA